MAHERGHGSRACDRPLLDLSWDGDVNLKALLNGHPCLNCCLPSTVAADPALTGNAPSFLQRKVQPAVRVYVCRCRRFSKPACVMLPEQAA